MGYNSGADTLKQTQSEECDELPATTPGCIDKSSRTEGDQTAWDVLMSDVKVGVFGCIIFTAVL